jgi:protein-S-isoprenylcysteine O-methyltransferase Ste14
VSGAGPHNQRGGPPFSWLDEEKFLRAHLSGYEEYRQKVRYRLIPFIW